MNPEPAAPLAGRSSGKFALFTLLNYYWVAAKGYRLRPWRSPYIRWRMETFFGRDAEPLNAGRFFSLLWRERKRLAEFLRWTRDFRRL